MDSVVSTAEVASSLNGQPYTAMKIDKGRWVGYTPIVGEQLQSNKCTVAMSRVFHSFLCTIGKGEQVCLFGMCLGVLSGRRMRGHTVLYVAVWCSDELTTRATTRTNDRACCAVSVCEWCVSLC